MWRANGRHRSRSTACAAPAIASAAGRHRSAAEYARCREPARRDARPARRRTAAAHAQSSSSLRAADFAVPVAVARPFSLIGPGRAVARRRIARQRFSQAGADGSSARETRTRRAIWLTRDAVGIRLLAANDSGASSRLFGKPTSVAQLLGSSTPDRPLARIEKDIAGGRPTRRRVRRPGLRNQTGCAQGSRSTVAARHAGGAGMTRLSVCRLVLRRWPAPARYFGGAERQQVLLARGLAARGHDVSFVTLDYGQDDGTVHGGIRAYKAYAPSDGVPGLRFFYPRWSGLVAAMRRSGSDAFYQMGADSETGQIAAWCRLHGKSFVFSMASDSDANPVLPLLRSRRQRALYRAGLRRADAVVAQTETQRAHSQAFAVDSRSSGAARSGIDPLRSASINAAQGALGRTICCQGLELLLDPRRLSAGGTFRSWAAATDAGLRARLEAARGRSPTRRCTDRSATRRSTSMPRRQRAL